MNFPKVIDPTPAVRELEHARIATVELVPEQGGIWNRHHEVRLEEAVPQRSWWRKLLRLEPNAYAYDIVPIATSSFEDAVAAASHLSSRWNGGLFSRYPGAPAGRYSAGFAVLQAVDGTYALSVLTGHKNYALAFDEFAEGRSGELVHSHGGLNATVTREHAALQAIVGQEYWMDLRNTQVGTAGTFAPLPKG